MPANPAVLISAPGWGRTPSPPALEPGEVLTLRLCTGLGESGRDRSRSRPRAGAALAPPAEGREALGMPPYNECRARPLGARPHVRLPIRR